MLKENCIQAAIIGQKTTLQLRDPFTEVIN